MNRILLDNWKDRLLAAEAVLSAPSNAVSEKAVRKVLTSTAEALRNALERLEALSCDLEALQVSSRTSQQQSDLLLRVLPFAAMTTSPIGEILAVNSEAAALLNTSTRYLVGKSVLLYMEDRESWGVTLRALRDSSATLRRVIALRPRERARKSMLVSVACVHDDTLYWVFLPPDCQVMSSQ